MSTAPPAADPQRLTLTLDDAQRQAMDYHLRTVVLIELDRIADVAAIYADADVMADTLARCLQLVEHVRALDAHELTAPADELADLIDGAHADAQEMERTHPRAHPDDLALVTDRRRALGRLRAQLDAALQEVL